MQPDNPEPDRGAGVCSLEFEGSEVTLGDGDTGAVNWLWRTRQR
jgi:hypothetical protein